MVRLCYKLVIYWLDESFSLEATFVACKGMEGDSLGEFLIVWYEHILCVAAITVDWANNI